MEKKSQMAPIANGSWNPAGGSTLPQPNGVSKGIQWSSSCVSQWKPSGFQCLIPVVTGTNLSNSELGTPLASTGYTTGSEVK
jgi:hypothetical protein